MFKIIIEIHEHLSEKKNGFLKLHIFLHALFLNLKEILNYFRLNIVIIIHWSFWTSFLILIVVVIMVGYYCLHHYVDLSWVSIEFSKLQRIVTRMILSGEGCSHFHTVLHPTKFQNLLAWLFMILNCLSTELV